MGHVLIVDDDEGIRDAVRFLLEDEGYQVQEAGDGEAALRIMRDSQVPLVVLLDLLMPHIDGIGVLREVTTDPVLRARHGYLLMTADSTTLRQQAEPWIAALSAEVVSKPFDLEHLLAAVERATRR